MHPIKYRLLSYLFKSGQAAGALARKIAAEQENISKTLDFLDLIWHHVLTENW
jgi:hypothetical protein